MFDVARSKIADRMRRLMPGRIARRFARKQDGAAAVEFALVAAPFLALLFAILETAMVFFASQTLEAATADSARLIMTGQAQSQGFSQADFKAAVCSRIFGLFDCANGVYVDVKTYTSFASINNTAPISNGVLDASKTGYNPGDVGDIVVVSLYYQWPIYISMFSSNLASTNLTGGNRLLAATAVLRVEPYK